MGDEQLGLETEEVVDDLNTTEVEEQFDDPVLDTEPDEEQSDSASFVDEAEQSPDALASPQAQAPPIPEHTPPMSDGGYISAPTPQQSYTPPPQQAPPPQQQVQFFSAAQLNEAVMSGIITEDQKIDQLQLQSKEQAKREIMVEMEARDREKTISQQLNEYNRLVPGWEQVGTPANLQASREYQRLLNLGLQETNITKLLALERTFGPAHRIRDARAAQVRTQAQRDTMPEVGRRGAPPSSRQSKDPIDILSLDEKRLYGDYIKKGIYKNWNEVRSEIKGSATQTSNPRLRAKHTGLVR